MGSSYFYLEFLIAWITCLQDRGYKNPAIFALEYTLVPDAQWPKQFDETRAAFRFVKDSFGDGAGSRICVSGDSAGATLVLSMLLHPAALDEEPQFDKTNRPALAILLSPWTHLVSKLNKNTPSDYLDNASLHRYAGQYAGKLTRTDAVVSPGLSTGRWNKASPLDGYRIVYGSEEVFAPGIEETVKQMKDDGALVKQYSDEAGIHAWPVVKLFLGASRKERLSGLQKMTDYIVESQLKPGPRNS